MQFLAPLFLAGLVAIAAPILFHLIRRATRQKQSFSSLLFLEPSPPRMTRRSRLDQLLLLLLRALVIALLALAFARPFLPGLGADDAGQTTERTIILLDTSASMRRAELWKEAVDHAVKTSTSIPANNELALMTFAQRPQVELSFETIGTQPHSERQGLVAAHLKTLEPSWMIGQLDQALLFAVESLAERATHDAEGNAVRQRIVLISDLQEGSPIDALQGYQWPQNLTVEVLPVGDVADDNAGLTLLNYEAVDLEQSAGRLRIFNTPGAQNQQFQVRVRQFDANGDVLDEGAPLSVQVPPGESRTMPSPALRAGASYMAAELIGDTVDFDNTVWFAPAVAQRMNILYLGADNPNDPQGLAYFLQRAFRNTPGASLKLTVRNETEPLDDLSPEAVSLVIASQTAQPEQASWLKQYLLVTNRVVFLAMRGTADWDLVNQLMVEAPAVRGLEESDPNRFALLGNVDFQHPLFSVFADPRYSDFSKIHFWRWRQVNLQQGAAGNTVARFDDGSPAIREFPVDAGRLVVMASTWRPADSQFALSTKFVPFLFSLLEWSHPRGWEGGQMTVGDRIDLGRLPDGALDEKVAITKPGGEEQELDADSMFRDAGQPGIYTIQSGTNRHYLAVNLPARESHTSQMPKDALADLGVPVNRDFDSEERMSDTGTPGMERPAKVEGRQKAWRWFVIAALILALAETTLAGWRVRTM